MNDLDPLSFINDIQIGSNSIVNDNWKLPQSVRLGLTSIISSNKPTTSTADFVIVTVIPYTGAYRASKKLCGDYTKWV
jgi:hypothetical protein